MRRLRKHWDCAATPEQCRLGFAPSAPGKRTRSQPPPPPLVPACQQTADSDSLKPGAPLPWGLCGPCPLPPADVSRAVAAGKLMAGRGDAAAWAAELQRAAGQEGAAQLRELQERVVLVGRWSGVTVLARHSVATALFARGQRRLLAFPLLPASCQLPPAREPAFGAAHKTGPSAPGGRRP